MSDANFKCKLGYVGCSEQDACESMGTCERHALYDPTPAERQEISRALRAIAAMVAPSTDADHSDLMLDHAASKRELAARMVAGLGE